MKIITDPNYRTITLLLVMSAMIILLMRQCGIEKDLKNQLDQSKKETEMAEWNTQAANDSVKTYRDKNGVLTAEMKSLWLTREQREAYTKQLESKYGKLKGKLASLTGVSGSINGTANNIKTQTTGDTIIKFYDDKDWGDGNYRNLSGLIPYKIIINKKGDTVSAYLDPGKASIGYNYGLTILTGIETIDGKPTIFVKSKHPELSISKIEGAQINPESLNLKKKNKWGLGASLGVGAIYGNPLQAPTLGFHFGIGLVFIPKKYQF